MKKLIVLLFVSAMLVIACGKKIMPESGASNQSKPANENPAKPGAESENKTAANTTPADNSKPSFLNTSNSMPAGQPETKSVNMDMGKTIFVTKCNTCHANKNSYDYTKEQMKDILKIEIPKAKLSSKEAEQLTTYLLANTK